MKDLREIIAKNLVDLRTREKMTQISLAEKLNYSDKAVSKWERGESMPDVTVLKQIADLFSVTVDYLLTEDHTAFDRERTLKSRRLRRNHFLVTMLAIGLVWMAATFLFFMLSVTASEDGYPLWLNFIYAIPTSAVVALVFNCIWGRRKWNFVIESVLLWTVLLSLYLSFSLLTNGPRAIWMLFLLGVPAEVLVVLFAGLKAGKNEAKDERSAAKRKKKGER